MGRRKKNVTPDVKTVVVQMVFADGPRRGDSIVVPSPPPQFMKVAMPEWAVYEAVGETYQCRVLGELALRWRNPVRPDLF